MKHWITLAAASLIGMSGTTASAAIADRNIAAAKNNIMCVTL